MRGGLLHPPIVYQPPTPAQLERAKRDHRARLIVLTLLTVTFICNVTVVILMLTR